MSLSVNITEIPYAIGLCSALQVLCSFRELLGPRREILSVYTRNNKNTPHPMLVILNLKQMSNLHTGLELADKRQNRPVCLGKLWSEKESLQNV